jgi:VAD1 Analog of StAR-related lipid transfer domain
MVDHTDLKLHLISLAKVRDVPYCDSFSVEEEILVLAPSPTAPCSIMRITTHIIWHKSTMFKSKISSAT